jgi:hypothetical protein
MGRRGSSLVLDPACAPYAFIRGHFQRRLVSFGMCLCDSDGQGTGIRVDRETRKRQALGHLQSWCRESAEMDVVFP